MELQKETFFYLYHTVKLLKQMEIRISNAIALYLCMRWVNFGSPCQAPSSGEYRVLSGSFNMVFS